MTKSISDSRSSIWEVLPADNVRTQVRTKGEVVKTLKSATISKEIIKICSPLVWFGFDLTRLQQRIWCELKGNLNFWISVECLWITDKPLRFCFVLLLSQRCVLLTFTKNSSLRWVWLCKNSRWLLTLGFLLWLFFVSLLFFVTGQYLQGGEADPGLRILC